MVTIAIGINMVIFHVRLRLMQRVFGIQEKKMLRRGVIMGSISAGVIVLYPQLLNDIAIQKSQISSLSIISYGVYLLLWSVTVFLLINRNITWKFLAHIAMCLGVVCISSVVWYYHLIGQTLLYYVVMAMGEELIKYSSGYSFFNKYQHFASDILIFMMIAGLGFGLIENIIYLISAATSIHIVGFGIARGLVGLMAHMWFSTTMGYVMRKGTKNNYPRSGILAAYSISVALHALYNVGLSYQSALVAPALLVIGYVWISYVCYLSDRLYVDTIWQDES